MAFLFCLTQRHPPKMYNPWHVSLSRMVRSKCVLCISHSCISTFCELLSFPGHAPRLLLWGPWRGQVGDLFISLYTMWTELEYWRGFCKQSILQKKTIRDICRQMEKNCQRNETNEEKLSTWRDEWVWCGNTDGDFYGISYLAFRLLMIPTSKSP